MIEWKFFLSANKAKLYIPSTITTYAIGFGTDKKVYEVQILESQSPAPCFELKNTLLKISYL